MVRRAVPEDADHTTWKDEPGKKPLIMSEFGGQRAVLREARRRADTVFSEEYQAGLYRHQLPSLKRERRRWRGMSPWVLMDFSLAAAGFFGGSARLPQPQGADIGQGPAQAGPSMSCRDFI